RIELLLDEIVIRQGNTLEFECDLEDRLVAVAHGIEHLMAGLLHNLRPRGLVLLDAVAETPEPEGVALFLCALDIFRDTIDRPDFLQHLKCSLVGAAMGWPPQAGNASRDASKGIGSR